MRINNCNYCWQTSNGKNRNCHPRIVESEIMGAGSQWSLDTTPGPTGAENLRGGLHAVTGSTGNDAVVADSARALRQFSNSCGVMKVKENLGEAIRIRVSVIILSWFLGISWLELEPA
jgi:hypothetical protein